MSGGKADSIGRGASSIGIGRILGTLISFALLMVITRRSESDVGVFRTLATFLIVAETIPLLGTHRWLATQMAADSDARGQLFASAMAWAACTSVLLGVAYAIISASGAYAPEVSTGLLYIGLATLPSGALLVEQAALIGIGRSGRVGLLNLAESVVRSVAGIALIFNGADILSVIASFAAIRWITGYVGERMVSSNIGRIPWNEAFSGFGQLRALVPSLSGVMICALAVRNAPLVLLASRASTAETGYFAVSFQLADLALLAPTVLVLSSTFLMSRYGQDSPRELRRIIVAMLATLGFVLLPAVGLTCALAAPVLALLFGPRMQAAAFALQAMMVAVPFMAADQVMSQALVSVGRYRADLASTASAAVIVCALTLVLSSTLGAAAAALANLAAYIVAVLVRMHLLSNLRIPKLLFPALWRSVVAAGAATVAVLLAVKEVDVNVDSRWELLWAAPGVALYGIVLWGIGGFRVRDRERILYFISHRG